MSAAAVLTRSAPLLPRPSSRRVCPIAPQRTGEPFLTAEEAWWWTCAALEARRSGARHAPGLPRLCTPDDMLRWLDRLYADRRITLAHARVLRRYGEEGRAPVAEYPSEAADAALWAAVMRVLRPVLRAKGVVI